MNSVVTFLGNSDIKAISYHLNSGFFEKKGNRVDKGPLFNIIDNDLVENGVGFQKLILVFESNRKFRDKNEEVIYNKSIEFVKNHCLKNAIEFQQVVFSGSVVSCDDIFVFFC